jgi:membrane protein
MKARIITVALTILSIFGTLTAKEIENNNMENLKLTQGWDKKFPQSDKVNHRKVTFKNRFGIELAADVYEPKDNNAEAPALAVAGPFGAVKEQVSGRYAQATPFPLTSTRRISPQPWII